MTNEHTIKNGASQIDGCAKHVRDTFLAQGYKVEVVKPEDSKCKEVLVLVANIKGTVEGHLKCVTGLDVGVILRLWKNGDDLRFCCGVSNVSKINSVVRVALGGGIGIFNPLMYAGIWREQRLLENVLRVAMAFFNNDVVINAASGPVKKD